MNPKTVMQGLQSELQAAGTLSYVDRVFIISDNTEKDIIEMVKELVGDRTNIIIIDGFSIVDALPATSSQKKIYTCNVNIYCVYKTGERMDTTNLRIIPVAGTPQRGIDLSTFVKNVIDVLDYNKLTALYCNLGGHCNVPEDAIEIGGGIYTQLIIYEGKRFE